MKNETLPFNNRQPKPFVRALKATCLALALAWCGQRTLAQSVGVNTNNPDPSASLEVFGTNKGLLLPRVSLTSLTDKTTIPNPATALLVYNTNAGLGKTGFYYNSGTSGNPVWSLVGAGASTLTLPFSQAGTNSGPMFLVNNLDANAGSIGISGIAGSAIGVRGATLSGTGVVGHSASSGKGVLASTANINGTALEVNGRMQIHGPGQTIGAGKVLTSDASGYATWQNAGGDAVAFSASGVKSGGSASIPQNVPVKVSFDIENYDLGTGYNNSNDFPHSTFIAPVNGIYHFDVHIDWLLGNNLLTVSELVRIRGNVTTSLFRSGNRLGENAFSIDCQLLAGDQVFVSVQQNETGNLQLNSFSSATYFNGRLVVKQ